MDLIFGTDPIASWILTLFILVVVVLVVSCLLILILKTARDINREVAVVWNNGQRVANNTIHIAGLYPIGKSIKKVLTRAAEIAESTGGIIAHADECNSCPSCIWTRKE